MVVISKADALWTNVTGSAPEYDGSELRRADAGLFAGNGATLGVLSGILRHGASSLTVTVDGSDNVTVQPGSWVVTGATGSSGAYRCGLGIASSIKLDARNSTNPRIDLVVARVYDTDVVPAHAAKTGQIETIMGQPAASPVAPTLPPMAVELARVTVPAVGGGAVTVDSSKRVYAAANGGTVAVESAAILPAGAAKWQQAVALDTGARYTWTGTAWSEEGAVVTFAPSSPNLPINATTSRARYIRQGRRVSVEAVLNVTGAAGPDWQFTLPVPADTSGGTGGVEGLLTGGIAATNAGSGVTLGGVYLISSTRVGFFATTTGGPTYGTSVPHTWKAGDAARPTFSYLAAS